jgi:hypothetical protein
MDSQECFHNDWPEQAGTIPLVVSSTDGETAALLMSCLLWMREDSTLEYETDSMCLLENCRKGRSAKPSLNKMLKLVYRHTALLHADLLVSWHARDTDNQVEADKLSHNVTSFLQANPRYTVISSDTQMQELEARMRKMTAEG